MHNITKGTASLPPNQVEINGRLVGLDFIRSQINQFKQVSDCLVRAEKDAVGEIYLAAYVVTDPEVPICQDEPLQYVDSWKMVFDAIYEEPEPYDEIYYNFSGWFSSYTGMEIPEYQMKEWLEGTLRLIRRYKPQRVLEIGCGTGMILLNLAPDCMVYKACDLSKYAIQNIRLMIGKRAECFSGVEIQCCGAHEFADYFSETFDTIVINSVIQYFPDINYFVTVMERCIQMIGESGRIIIGDVRNFDLMEAFYLSLGLYKSNDLEISEFLMKFQEERLNEKELLISPEFFLRFAASHPRISSIEIFEKKGIFDTEMNLFRYDVVLHVNEDMGQESAKIKKFHIDTVIREPAAVERAVASGGLVVMEGIIKPQIKNLYELLSGEKSQASGEIDFFSVIAMLMDRYELYPLWSQDSQKGYSRIAIGPKGKRLSTTALYSRKEIADNHQSYNTPMRKEKDLAVLDQLKGYLQRELPEYLIPKKINIVEEIPLTVHGGIAPKGLES